MPAFLAPIALLANLKPIVPGTPIWTNASVNLPKPVSSAKSSAPTKSCIESKVFSTLAARSLPKPRSINSAAREKTPSGTLIKPDAIPAAPDINILVSLFCSAFVNGSKYSTAIYIPMPLGYLNYHRKEVQKN